MKTTTLGINGPRVLRLGFGSMQMSWKPASEEHTAIATIQAALDAGLNYLDTSDFYGMGRAEHLIGHAASTEKGVNQFWIPAGVQKVIWGRKNCGERNAVA